MSRAARTSESANQMQITSDLHFSGQPEIKPKTFPRTDVRYWREKVKRPTIRGKESPNYGVQIAYQGKRRWFSFETANRDEAAREAQAVFLQIKVNGWPEAEEKYRPESVRKGEVPTVGAYLEEVRAVAQLEPRTIAEYEKSFRRLVAQIQGIESDDKFDWRNGKAQDWRARVDRVKLSAITPSKVQKWKNTRIADASGDPSRQKSARNTINSIIRNSKALFGRKVLPFIRERFDLPDPLPIQGVDLFPRQSTRYASKIDAQKYLSRAADELGVPGAITEAEIETFIDDYVVKMTRARMKRGCDGPFTLTDQRRLTLIAEAKSRYGADQQSRREQWKILILALCVGLRFDEIDKLLWTQIDFDRCLIRIETSQYFRPKTEDSAGDIDIDPEVAELLRGYRALASDEFVIEANRLARPDASYSSYRSEIHYKRLLIWLRDQFFDGQKPLAKVQKPIHELRKEAGSIVARDKGLFAASRFLRHSDTRITAAYYLDKKEIVTTGLGSLLPASNIVELADHQGNNTGAKAM
ncbi:MAG: integrase [Verrucomicrobiales bacterium]|jgi:integrase